MENEKDRWQREADAAASRVTAYAETVDRLEPDIAPIDASAFYASAAISLRRIADALEAVAEWDKARRSAIYQAGVDALRKSATP